MIGTGLAILGAGLLGAGASIFGASKASKAQSDAANSAADVQREAMGIQRENLNFQRGAFGEAKGNLDPFIKSGVGANNILASAYGLNGSDPALGQSTLERFRQSPDYQFALKGGSDALDNSAAAKGGMISGNQIRAQTEYGQGLATQNLQSYFSRLAGMSQQGMQAGGYLGQMGTNIGNTAAGQLGASANNIGNSMMAGGTAEASGILGMTKGLDSGLNSLSLYNQMGKSSYGSNYLANYNGNQIGGLY